MLYYNTDKICPYLKQVCLKVNCALYITEQHKCSNLIETSTKKETIKIQEKEIII